MARQNKKSKNELDVILEQLKKSYASDSQDTLEDDLLKSPEREEDTELNEILGKIFSFNEEENIATVKQNELSLEEKPLEENTHPSDNNENDGEGEAENEGNILHNKSEEAEACPVEVISDDETSKIANDNIIEEPPVDNLPTPENDTVAQQNDSDEKEAVDNVLNIMFSRKAKSEKSDLGGKAVESIIEDTVSSSDTSTEDTEITPVSCEEERVTEESIEQIDLEASEEDLISLQGESNVEIENDTQNEFFEESSAPLYEENRIDELHCEEEECSLPFDDEQDDDIQILESEAEEDDIDEICETDTSFAVEDEEYSVCDEYEQPQSEEEPSYETITLSNIVLTQTRYTSDPLQDGFPTIGSFKIPSVISHESNVSNADKNNAIRESISSDQKEDTFTENDISLLLNIGYDNEVRSKVGEKKTQKVLLDAENNFEPDPTKKVFGFCGKELTDKKQIPEIKEKYKTSQKNMIILLSVISTLSLFLLYLTLSFEFSTNKLVSFPAFLTMDFILVMLIMTILYKKLISGVNKLMKLETNHNTLFFFVSTAHVTYTLASLLAYAFAPKSLNPDDLMLFGFCVSIYAVLSLTSDFFNCIREKSTFDVITSADTLYTAEKATSVPHTKYNRKRRSDDEHTYNIRKTKLISGYFRKTSKNDATGIKPMYLLGIVPIFSLSLGLITLFISSSLSLCISVVMMATLLCIPIPYMFSSSLIRFFLLSPTPDKKLAYVGNSAPIEMEKTTQLIFKDSDSVEILGYTEIQPNGKSSPSETLKIAYDIFNTLGGPLSCINSEESNKKHHEVVINQISDDGIDLYYDSSINVLLGDKHYMQMHNIKVKTDSNLLAATKGSDRSVIFMAFDGIPKLGFIVNSRIKPRFLKMSEVLLKSGIQLSVETYEPQINDLYFDQNKGHFHSSVNVFKPDHYEPNEPRDICDGCMVSTTDGIDLALAISQSRIIAKRLKYNNLVNIAVLSACIIASIVLTFFVSKNMPAWDALNALRSHLTVVFNAIMLASLIPAAFETFAIFKDKIGKKPKSPNKSKSK